MTTVGQICDYLKQVAPLHLAEDWDNVGLLLGNPAQKIARLLTCLTLTTDVAEEAVRSGAGMIVTHHPILFKPVKRITAETVEGRLLSTLIQNQIAVYSPHTAWDNCSTGINQQLAELLELREVAPLRPRSPSEQIKIVTFVPQAQLESVRSAMWDAGAGEIGDYHHCSFQTRGTGTFFGSDTTNPSVGSAGQLEQVEEFRLEVICSPKRIERVLAALRQSHPYEEPAVDLINVKTLPDGSGSGRFGVLPSPVAAKELISIVSQKLRQPSVQFVGDPDRPVTQVGIACGAAAEFLRDAHRAGCQVLLTGEARFHSSLEARDLGIGLILPGHFATERFAMESLASRLERQLPSLAAFASESETDPVRSA